MGYIMIFALLGLAASPVLKSPSSIPCTQDASVAVTSSAEFLAICGTAADTQAYSTSATYSDALNISGAGVLEFLAFAGPSSGSNVAEVTVTIDGVVVINALQITATGGFRVPVGSVSAIDIANQRACATLGSVPFSSSCRVQLRRVSGSNNAVCAIKYRLH